MYIRFITSEVDPDSHCSAGVFAAAYRLRDEEALYDYEKPHIDELLAWFRENLKIPTRFTASKPPYYRKKNKAISWFRETATEHIAKLREIIAVVENHGVAVQMIIAENPGYVVYEDEHQVVAEPFADSRF